MPRTLAFCILHYGTPYLETAIQALLPQVDQIVLLYTSSPSQGFGTELPCPDTREELKAIADKYPEKVLWHEGTWNYEGEHTDAVREFQEGYDWLLRFDSDEVYQPGSVARLIQQAEITTAKIFRVPFLHFWRSFSRVCRDGQMPDRLFRVNGGEGFAYIDDGYLLGTPEINRVLHFGYAQPSKYIEYKMSVSGHKSEWRQDWYTDKWLANAQKDIHPVVFDFWNAEVYDKTLMPDSLKIHPNFMKEVIE